ncbi:MAG: DUF4255 domain-containing protein [Syntrophomonadaceae bacterium]|nr:DUF4255 domain-containing protein [Syntrophomonadaceae bacterium]
MGSYTIIAEIGNAIVQLLRDNLVPGIIINTENIGLCIPSDRGDIVLGINLYDIRENQDIVITDMIPKGVNQLKYPSSFYDLYYMITAYSSSDIKFRAAEDQKILGKVLQVLKDNPTFTAEQLGSELTNSRFVPKIELLQLENDEKMKLWNVPDTPCKLSLYYKVYPVEIESNRVKEVKRVVDVDFTIQEA